jgi:hypothetical protein
MLAPVSIRCNKCKQKSYNPDDIENKYCGWCHEFHAEELAYELGYPIIEARPPSSAEPTKGHSER